MVDIGLAGFLLDRAHSGTAVYTRNLAEWLPVIAPDYRFRLYTHRPEGQLPSVRTSRLKTPLSPLVGRHTAVDRLDKLAWECATLPLISAAYGEDLLHSLYFAAPPFSSARLVVTVHDVAPLVLSGYHRSRWSDLYARAMSWTARRADAVITVSHYSRRQIIDVLGIDERRVHVIYEAADSRFQPAGETPEGDVRFRLGLPERFFLYIGGAEKRKNIETLVRAWATVAARMKDLRTNLVIVADFPPPDSLYPDVPGLVRSLGLGDSITIVPSVREGDKPALYRAALALCFPSTFEGFGFTPLEAMASGVPVIASRATSLPEVVGGAGILLDPMDVEAWGTSLLHLAESPAERVRLSLAGPVQANTFSWQRTAKQTVEVYREVLGT